MKLDKAIKLLKHFTLTGRKEIANRPELQYGFCKAGDAIYATDTHIAIRIPLTELDDAPEPGLFDLKTGERIEMNYPDIARIFECFRPDSHAEAISLDKAEINGLRDSIERASVINKDNIRLVIKHGLISVSAFDKIGNTYKDDWSYGEAPAVLTLDSPVYFSPKLFKKVSAGVDGVLWYQAGYLKPAFLKTTDGIERLICPVRMRG